MCTFSCFLANFEQRFLFTYLFYLFIFWSEVLYWRPITSARQIMSIVKIQSLQSCQWGQRNTGCCRREKYWITLENSCTDCLCWQSDSPWLRKGVRKYGNVWSVPAVVLVPGNSQNTCWVHSPSGFYSHCLWPPQHLLQGKSHSLLLLMSSPTLRENVSRSTYSSLPSTCSLFSLCPYRGKHP